MEIRSITGTITLADGTTTQFTVDGYGWRQYETRGRAAEFVETLDAIERGAADVGLKDPYSD